MTGQFGLSVRFTLKEGAAAAFDALVAETLAGIRASEPGTLVYVSRTPARSLRAVRRWSTTSRSTG
jgi:quinol monooxygenase YgiN